MSILYQQNYFLLTFPADVVRYDSMFGICPTIQLKRGLGEESKIVQDLELDKARWIIFMILPLLAVSFFKRAIRVSAFGFI